MKKYKLKLRRLSYPPVNHDLILQEFSLIFCTNSIVLSLSTLWVESTYY